MTDVATYYAKRDEWRQSLRDKLTAVLATEPLCFDPMGDTPDTWEGKDWHWHVSITYEFTVTDKVCITSLDVVPQRQGFGTLVVDTIGAWAKAHGMTVAVNNALPEAMAFWLAMVPVLADVGVGYDLNTPDWLKP